MSKRDIQTWHVDRAGSLRWSWPHLTQRGSLTVAEKIGEWMNWFRVNVDTNGVDRTIADIPKIKGSAIVVDNPMSGNLDKHLESLKQYEGKILCCDRAAWKLAKEDIIPYIVGNVDASVLCLAFFDRPEMRKLFNESYGVFSVCSHPLTVRAWHNPKRRMFFMPDLGEPLTSSLCGVAKVPRMTALGCIHNTLYLLAYNLGASPIGLLGVENSYPSLDDTEYPDCHHEVVEGQYGVCYADDTYLYYDRALKEAAEILFEEGGVKTYQLSKAGITYSKFVEDLGLEEFIAKHS